MTDTLKTWDPRGLIEDALALEGLAVEEYRAIFFDWAFGLKDPETAAEAAQALLAHYRNEERVGHPIIGLLEEASGGAAKRRGRTGRRREAMKRWDSYTPLPDET